MKLNVPLVLQRPGRGDCGPACIAMVMDYYGLDTSISKINSELNRDYKKGMNAPELGLYLVSNQFDVGIITFNADDFVKGDELCGAERFLSIVRKSQSYLKKRADCFEDFVAMGGKVKLKVPTLDDIVSGINAGRPLIANMTSRFMFAKKDPGFNEHYCVVTGIDDNFVYVNDPFYKRRKCRHSDFLFGLYAKTCCSIGCLITVEENLSGWAHHTLLTVF